MIDNKNKCTNLFNQKPVQNWCLQLSIEQQYLVNSANFTFLSFGYIFFYEVPFCLWQPLKLVENLEPDH